MKRKKRGGRWVHRMLGEAERWREIERDMQKNDTERERWAHVYATTHVWKDRWTEGKEKVRDTWCRECLGLCCASLWCLGAASVSHKIPVPPAPSPAIPLAQFRGLQGFGPAWSCFLGKGKLVMGWTHVTSSTRMRSRVTIETNLSPVLWLTEVGRQTLKVETWCHGGRKRRMC